LLHVIFFLLCVHSIAYSRKAAGLGPRQSLVSLQTKHVPPFIRYYAEWRRLLRLLRLRRNADKIKTDKIKSDNRKKKNYDMTPHLLLAHEPFSVARGVGVRITNKYVMRSHDEPPAAC
jgi:hypothetical protein